MLPSLDCPWSQRLPLVDGALPPEQQESFERHLESCPACQARIVQDEENDRELLALVRQFGDPTIVATDLTLAQTVERLHETKGLDQCAPAGQVDLSFLCPSDQPGVLGTLGAYEVQEVIGQGGMGVVLKAFDPALQRQVAIKVIAPALAGSATARKLFTREARAAAAVSHDHIVAVHVVSESDGLPYLVMQYVAGESLQSKLDRSGPLDLVDIVRIGQQTASGLAAAHTQGLIHRDIKPANLLLETPPPNPLPEAERGSKTAGSLLLPLPTSGRGLGGGVERVKITDFGLACLADAVASTQNGVLAGTPEYMAPEQARGEPIDHRADLFSLGSVLYALCTGVPPFRGPTPAAVLCQLLEEPTPLGTLQPDVPPWLEALIARLMARNPADRFQSAAEVADLLEGYLVHLRHPTTVPAPDSLSSPANDSSRQTQSGQRLRRQLGLLLLLSVLGLGFSLVSFAGVGQEPIPEANDPARKRLAFDFRNKIEDMPELTLFGPEAELLVTTDPRGLRINLPEGRQDCRNVGVELPLRLTGDFAIELGYEILNVGAPIPDPATGVQLRLKLDDASLPLVALARFRNRYGARPAPLFGVVGHDGETFAAYRISILPNGNESPKGMDVRARMPAGRLKLVRTGPQLQYLVSDGGSPYHLLKEEEIGNAGLESLSLFGFSGWAPVHVDVLFTDLVIEAGQLPEALPPRILWEKTWVAARLLIALGVILSLGGVFAWWYKSRPATNEARPPRKRQRT